MEDLFADAWRRSPSDQLGSSQSPLRPRFRGYY